MTVSSLGSASAVRNFCSVSPRAPNAAMDRTMEALIGEQMRFPETSSATAYKICIKTFIIFCEVEAEEKQEQHEGQEKSEGAVVEVQVEEE